MENILLSDTIKRGIIEHCLGSYPREACGVLAGKDNRAEILYTLENISQKPESCYEIDSRQTLRISKELRAKNLVMVGIYHSHTNSPAYPSSRDLELAFYPDSFYLIVSLQDRDNPQIRSFKVIESKVEETEIIS